MQLFLSTYISKVDDKRRVSVPVQFRTVLGSKRNSSVVYAYCSFINKCIVVCPEEQLAWIEQHLGKLNHFSEERDVIVTAILSGCEQMQLDAKGRVLLSEALLNFAEVDNEVAFVGKGTSFEIWNKNNFFAYYNQARLVAAKMLNI